MKHMDAQPQNGSGTEWIIPADYPELCRLAWNRDVNKPIDGAETLQIYEAAWRHVDEQAMLPME